MAENDLEENRGELAALAWIASRSGPVPPGETWAGDDTAVLQPGDVLFATDALVEDVHFSRRFGSLADAGWKSLATNLSDLAAMGGEPRAAVVAVAGAVGRELQEVFGGLEEAAAAYGCPLVGGDLTDGPCIVISVAILGSTNGRTPVLRDGARPGDLLFVSGPTGAAAAGLRLLQADSSAEGPLVAAHRRPIPRFQSGRGAALAGATAMIDISDGLALDLDRICRASGVGVELERLPVAEGASQDDALSGGDDYELLFAAPSEEEVRRSFLRQGAPEPIRIGKVVSDSALRTLEGRTFVPAGYVHGLS